MTYSELISSKSALSSYSDDEILQELKNTKLFEVDTSVCGAYPGFFHLLSFEYFFNLEIRKILIRAIKSAKKIGYSLNMVMHEIENVFNNSCLVIGHYKKEYLIRQLKEYISSLPRSEEECEERKRNSPPRAMLEKKEPPIDVEDMDYFPEYLYEKSLDKSERAAPQEIYPFLPHSLSVWAYDPYYMLSFTRINIPEIPCIYFVLNQSEDSHYSVSGLFENSFNILYIGATTNLRKRLKNHKEIKQMLTTIGRVGNHLSYTENTKPLLSLRLMYLPLHFLPLSDIKRIESLFIRSLNPAFNISCNDGLN